MSSPTGSPWSDRRGLFQKGKEIHEPGRRLSTSSTGAGGVTGMVDAVRRASVSSTDGLEKTTSNTSSTAEQRRMSSSGGGLFANLTQHKRGSEDYGQRRASHHDQTNQGGFFSGWYQSTFKGAAAKPPTDMMQPQTNMQSTQSQSNAVTKRGVME